MAAINLGAKKRATFNELRVAEVRPLTESSVEVTFEEMCIRDRDHAVQWVLRLAGGTDESRERIIVSLNEMWPYVEELFTDCLLYTSRCV